jgi:hypothetical protein
MPPPKCFTDTPLNSTTLFTFVKLNTYVDDNDDDDDDAFTLYTIIKSHIR